MVPAHPRDTQLKIQAGLSHQFWLPFEPTRELYRYYSTLGCITLVEKDKILALVIVPLLDKEVTFQLLQVINLPIPYPNPKQKLGVVVEYKLEPESIAFNLARIKFMLLTKMELEKCKRDALRICTSQSPIYATRSHQLCLVELFSDYKEGTERTCHVEVSMGFGQ